MGKKNSSDLGLSAMYVMTQVVKHGFYYKLHNNVTIDQETRNLLNQLACVKNYIVVYTQDIILVVDKSMQTPYKVIE